MKILAVDPGYERLGIAILDNSNNKNGDLIFSECFRTSAEDEHSQRLSEIQERIEELIKEYSPKELAIEDLFFSVNTTSAMKVAETRGAIISSSKKSGLNIFEYNPQEIKVAVGGDGHCDKKAVIKMIPLLIKIDNRKRLDDEYDAIACGLTHFAINGQK